MTFDLDELERLARAAMQFFDWAAGEGLCPIEEDIPSPEDALFEFASKTGNEDYASYPDVTSGVFARLREAETEVRRLTTVPNPVVKRVSDILDEKSAWIARPSPEVTEAIALAATIAAHSIIRECDTEAERYVQATEAARDRLKAERDEAVGVLEDVANPMRVLQRHADSVGGKLDGNAAHQFVNEPYQIKKISADYLAKHGGDNAG